MSFKIATYNLQSLFDYRGDNGSTRPKPEFQRRALVTNLNHLRADVVAVQEVESTRAMREINQWLKNPYPYVESQPGNSQRGLHLGFFSRFPMTLRTHSDVWLTDETGRDMWEHRSERDSRERWLYPLGFQRDVLAARIKVSTRLMVTIFNLHLKSQHDNEWMVNRAHRIREAEARAAADIITAYEREKEIEPCIVVGDLNERCAGVSIQPLVRDLSYRDIGSEIAGPGSIDYTYHRPGRRCRIDYILLSSQASRLYEEGSVRIHGDYAGARVKASDHFAVSARLSG